LFTGKHQVEQIAIHPKYDGTAECGFDIALGLLSEDMGGSQYDKDNYSMIGSKVDSFMFEIDPKDLKYKDGDKPRKVMIAGYPGSK